MAMDLTKHNKKWLCLMALLFCVTSLFSQFYNGSNLSFGKNRVQYQNFNWTYYRTEDCDVYFYPTGKMLAQYTAWKAPKMIEEVEKFLNYTATKKIQFIVYNTQSDFRESNFAYDNDDFYNQGGVTNIYGTKVYLYFDGDHTHFDQMLRSGIMNVYAHFLVEGENLRSNISAEYLVQVPEWFYTGLASYYGETWNADIDEHVKNGILTQKYADFDELSPVDARYAAHSFWKYIADTYGENSILTILYATRAYHSIESGFVHALGHSYKGLLINWYRHYYILYKKDMKRTKVDVAGEIKKPKAKREYDRVRFSPDGENYAFVTNEAGQVRVWLKTPKMKKPQSIFRRYHKTEDNPDLTYPIIGWHPNGEIVGFTIEEEGRCYYYPYNIKNKKLGDRQLVDVEKITDFVLSNDGKLLLFSGIKNGQSDIFIYSFLAKSFQQITNDIYDDEAPRFIQNQKKIVFSSNRPHDSLKLKEAFYAVSPQKTYDLFLYHYDTKDKKLLRITKTPYANESEVREMQNGEILYLSDENGINNRYSARFDSSISKIDTIVHYAYRAKNFPLTDYAYNISDFDYNPSNEKVAEIIRRKGTQNIYLSPVTEQALAEKPQLSGFQEKMREERTRRDSLEKVKATAVVARHGFRQVRESDLIKQKNNDEKTSRNGLQDNALTEGLSFMQEVPKNYYIQYNINKLVTQADFSFLNTSYQQFTGGISPIYLNSTINALLMFGLNDLFENHRITAGYRLAFNLHDYEVMFSYENLSKRVDQQIVLYRQSLRSNINDYIYKQHTNSIFYITKYPIDKFNSFRLTLTGRYDRYIMGSLNDYSLQEKDENHFWGGIKLEYVFDSAKELYTNLWKGAKCKIFAEYMHRIDKENKNLLVLGFDYRKSIKLYKKMTLALRLAGSTNFGKSRLVYYMGGVDNWVGAKFNSNIWVDLTKDYAYQTLATNMRGFEQNIRNGTSFVLFSGELRIPFVQLIAKKNVSNNFLNSLQLIVFGDVGTAWTGLTPYSADNCLYTRYVFWGSNYSNWIKIKRQTEPFVGGFGLGLRASLLGYFLRLDYAWGVEDFKIYNKKGMFTFSIGLDF